MLVLLKKFIYASGVPGVTSHATVFVAAAQGMPLDYTALVANRPCIFGSQGTVRKLRDCSWTATIPRAQYQHGRLKHISSLSVNEANLLVLALQPEGQAPGLAPS